ncbi:IS110 family transposase (plasmid) [Mycobacterium sp. SMC-8]|uniref:IS110 family transposase n=1 Tax=Mycobacterium sp. SMC-8 TaxID=2857060 RepID=UPI0021B4798E|nr:IS110 family transposase [Mycobacterium sp. SMC-8]UXA15810.1 IS110 family transposase [Mycobacterium sp. SMC-8]
MIVAEAFERIVGIDTHARTHTFCVIDSRTGAVVAGATFPNTNPGHSRALSWIHRHTPAMSVLAAVEGTSSYGAGITAALGTAGIEVTESRPVGRRRDRAGKSDVIDAELAARSVLGIERDRIPAPRRGAELEDLRILLAARRILDQQRTANRNALTALLRTVDLGVDARKPLHDNQIRAIAVWRINQKQAAMSNHVVARREARRLAKAVLEHTTQLQDNHQQLRALAAHAAPGLQELSGVGPVTAAIIICAYSHRGRIRSEAAFAALGGVAPIPASSGNTTRHRLSRAGDRQLNRAFDIIVRTRMTSDPTTRAYVARRTAEGMSTRETRRCLKRYVCRSVFRHLQAAA